MSTSDLTTPRNVSALWFGKCYQMRGALTMGRHDRKIAWLQIAHRLGFPCAEVDGRAGGYFQSPAPSQNTGWPGIKSRPRKERARWRSCVGGGEKKPQHPGTGRSGCTEQPYPPPANSICATRLLWVGLASLGLFMGISIKGPTGF